MSYFMLSSTMISSSTLHVGRHGSTHSLQQIQLSAARNLQQQPASPDSPQLPTKVVRHHDTITEGEESACSDDDRAEQPTDDGVKSNSDPTQQSTSGHKHKKGSISSHKDRR